MRQVTREEWARLRRAHLAHYWDGRPYAMKLRYLGEQVFEPVEIKAPLIERKRRDD
jgi:hypothetical protein